MDALARAAAEHPHAPALIGVDGITTYAELNAAAWGVADLIAASGTLGQHAVAFWGARTPETVAAVWGVPRTGVAAVPIDPRLAPATAMDATRSAGVRGLWVAPPGGLDRLMERGDPVDGPLGEYIVFTSGSQGKPKGVRITQGNIEAAVSASRLRLGHGRGDTWLGVLPLFHVGGLAILWRQAESAAPVVLHEAFDAAEVARALPDVTLASVVPVMLRRLLAAGASGSPGLRAVLVGGAASDRELLSAAREAGIPAVPTYGMTETTSQIATPDPDDPLDGTVGSALEGAEIRVMRDETPVVGEQGRIEVRGPMVSPGYVGEVPRGPEDWFTTSDIGVVDSSGRLIVVGRADSGIVTGGENVHPAAVEAALRVHDEIHDIRVFGVADAQWGEIVVAEVVTDLDRESLDRLAARLPAAMRPRRWQVVPRMHRKLDG